MFGKLGPGAARESVDPIRGIAMTTVAAVAATRSDLRLNNMGAPLQVKGPQGGAEVVSADPWPQAPHRATELEMRLPAYPALGLGGRGWWWDCRLLTRPPRRQQRR